MIERAFVAGVLDRKVHQRLVSDLEGFAERAGIPPEAICTALGEYVGPDEEAWIRTVLKSRRNPPPGFAYVGNWPDVSHRIAGMCGALIRNFVNARVLTVERFIEERPSTTVVLIPNFHRGGGKIPGWMMAKLVDAFMERATTKATVITVATFKALAADYGPAVSDLVKSRFSWRRHER